MILSTLLLLVFGVGGCAVLAVAAVAVVWVILNERKNAPKD